MTVTYITSERGPRFVAHATCPSCGCTQIGITFHGVLSSGRKVYWLVPHSPGRRLVRNKEGRCAGSEQWMEVTADGWRPA